MALTDAALALAPGDACLVRTNLFGTLKFAVFLDIVDDHTWAVFIAPARSTHAADDLTGYVPLLSTLAILTTDLQPVDPSYLSAKSKSEWADTIERTLRSGFLTTQYLRSLDGLFHVRWI